MRLARIIRLMNGNIIGEKKLKELENSKDNCIKYRDGELKKDNEGRIIFSRSGRMQRIYSREGEYSGITYFS